MKHTSNILSTSEDRYKVVPNSNKWKGYKEARLQISVPLVPAYDEKFRHLALWAVENFDAVTLCLHDTIQRHNFIAFGDTPEAAYDKSLHHGNVWLEKNIFPSDVFMDVVRWDAIAQKEAFSSVHAKILKIYAEDEPFRDAINEDIITFVTRCKGRGEVFDDKRLRCSQDLLLEEISGYVVLNQLSSAADIHPGMRLKALPLLSEERFGFNLKDNLMTAVRVFDRQVLPEPVLQAQGKPVELCA